MHALLVTVLSISVTVTEPPRDPVAAATVVASSKEVSVPAASSSLRFQEVAQQRGLDFRYTFGDFAYDNILESSGSGVTWIDVDGDRDLDLYLLQGSYLPGISDPKGRIHQGASNRLYCQEERRFVDCTERSGLGDESWSMGAAAADFDGDGSTDLFVANYGPNRLYRNRGDGTFEEVADERGLLGPTTLNGFPKWSVGASWFDADRDGDLDLAVCNFLAFDPELLVAGREWEMPEPKRYAGQPSYLYLQESDGRFRDVTRQAGLWRPDSKCMGLTVFDWDGDGWPDLFQGNDHQPNFLFRSRADGSFEEIAGTVGVAVNDQGLGTGSMHGTPGDVDGDGRFDLLVVDLRHGSLYRQIDPLTFEDLTWASGVGRLLDGLGQWGAGLQDFDLDGDLDLFTTNGVAHILVRQRPALAVNDGRGEFRDAGPGAGPYFRSPRSGRGAAFADFDDDGDVDIVINHVDHEATVGLLENRSERLGHWIGFWLEGDRPREAYGARVEVVTDSTRFVRIHQPSASYLSGNDPRVHFGLGPSPEAVRLRVRWPSGAIQEWSAVPTDRYWLLREGVAEPLVPQTKTASPLR